MKPYLKYKDSGIEWLGDIPEEWNIEKPTRIFRLVKGINAATLTKEYISENQGVYPVYSGQTEDDGLMGSIEWYDFDFENPVVFITTVGAKAMTTRTVRGRFSLSQNCALAIPINSMIDARFFEPTFQRLFDYEKGSISLIMQPSLRFEDFNHFKVPNPSTFEQQAIASYLDRETARIDSLIQKKERMIELLKEKRIALITQAVTKGIDPKAKMKNSGIEWLGEVPEHWDVKRLRYCIRLNPSKKEISHLPKDTEVSFLPMENVGEDGALDLSENRAISEVDSGYTYFGENDVAIAKITPCFENGKGCVFRNLEHGYGFGSTELTVMRPIDLVPEFLYYLSVSTYFRKIGEALMHGSAGQKRVPNDYIRNLYIGLPSIEVQQQIVCYVHEKLRSIEALNDLTSLSIDKLREYRASLIHHAVTGKIDLRGNDAQAQ